MGKFTDRFKERPASYSFFSSWEWHRKHRGTDRDEWYNNYILNIRGPATPAMEYGNVVGDSIGTSDSLVPALKPPGVKEYTFKASIGKIHLIGHADHFSPKIPELHENKTSDNSERWNQKKVDEHVQIDMYLLLAFLELKIRPEDVSCYLNFIPVERGGDMLYKMPNPPRYIQFPTSRTMVQILRYGSYIEKTVKEMEEYVNVRQKL